MSEVVLDATALLALLLDGPGGKKVEERLMDAKVSAVGLAEVASRLADRGMPIEEIRSVVDALGIEVIPFDVESAYNAAQLMTSTRRTNLSLGGRASLALGRAREAVVITSDPDWIRLEVDTKVEIVR